MPETIKCISPVNGRVYASRRVATKKEIAAVFAAAHAAQEQWKRLPLAGRAVYCSAAVDAMIAMTEEIVPELAWQMGRPVRYGAGELRGFEERARYMIAIAEEALSDLDPGPKDGFVRYVKRDPLGVVFTIAPWNYPYLTAVNSIIPGLMAGNAVVLKHAASTLLVAERFQQAFDRAELPKGVFQHLVLDHKQTAEIIAGGHASMVCFTGSVAGGKAIEEASAGRFINVGLELGGKDPAYVRPDANMTHAIENLVDGAFFNSGQSCCGIERIYVHKKVWSDFLDGFVDLTKNKPRTPYMAPQVLTSVTHRMSVMMDESFGPVVGIMKVSGDEEALELMNDSPYGLTAAIWTQDVDAARAIGNELQTGTVFMNRCDYLDPALTWTGVKDTGRGATLSKVGYEALTRPKSYHLRTRT